jgi:methylphosphotriester-DNA--protein-cysteine methyltransferase
MRRHLILFSIAIGLLIFFSFSIYAQDYKYVASKYSIKYHRPTCKWAHKIQPQNMLKFKTAKEALAAGKVPCKVCNPPTKD